MYRLILLLGVILFPKVAGAQSITFNMHDGRNAKYVVVVDVSNQTLSVSKGGTSLFSKRYHHVKNKNGMIGFSFVQGKNPFMDYDENEQFFLITKGAIMYNKITSGQSLNFLEPDVLSSFSNAYGQLEQQLNKQTSSLTFTVNGVSFKMIKVEGGTFTMGATSEQGSDAYDIEKPTHQVTLSSYMIGETEVTQELWQAVMGNNPSYFTGNLQRPVEKVSWDDCQTFILKLNNLTGKQFRLPTEAEWEFAARGGNKSRGYKYASSNTIGDVAWYDTNAGVGLGKSSPDYGTHAVKTKSPNELGLYDMCGNVWEWCNDWYKSDYYKESPSSNPKGPSSGSGRVSRGGGWCYDAGRCRVSFRYNFYPGLRSSYLGLRLAL